MAQDQKSRFDGVIKSEMMMKHAVVQISINKSKRIGVEITIPTSSEISLKLSLLAFTIHPEYQKNNAIIVYLWLQGLEHANSLSD